MFGFRLLCNVTVENQSATREKMVDTTPPGTPRNMIDKVMGTFIDLIINCLAESSAESINVLKFYFQLIFWSFE